MSRLLRAYLRVLDKHPWKTQMATAGILSATGDALAQLVVEKRPLSKYDVQRTTRYLLFGTFAIGPILRTWFLTLERIWGPAESAGRLICKVATDQLLFAPLFIPFIVGSLTYWESRSVQHTKDKLKQDYLSILYTNWKIWPAAQLINFYYIPFQHRIMYVQIIALFWNTYLAWKISGPGTIDWSAGR